MGKIGLKNCFLGVFLFVFQAIDAKVIVPLEITPFKLPACTISFEGKDYHSMIDLALVSTRVEPSLISGKGIRFLDETRELTGISGEKEVMPVVEINALSIGGFPVFSFKGVVETRQRQIYSIYPNQPANGEIVQEEAFPPFVLGMTAFEKSIALFDYPNEELVLWNPDESYADQVKGWVELPFTLLRGCVGIEARKGEELAWFVLDTGTGANLLFDPNGTSDGKPVFERSPLNELEIQGEMVEVGFTLATNRKERDVHGILGYPFFAKRPILIDFPNRKVFFPLG